MRSVWLGTVLVLLLHASAQAYDVEERWKLADHRSDGETEFAFFVEAERTENDLRCFPVRRGDDVDGRDGLRIRCSQRATSSRSRTIGEGGRRLHLHRSAFPAFRSRARAARRAFRGSRDGNPSNRLAGGERALACCPGWRRSIEWRYRVLGVSTGREGRHAGNTHDPDGDRGLDSQLDRLSAHEIPGSRHRRSVQEQASNPAANARCGAA